MGYPLRQCPICLTMLPPPELLGSWVNSNLLVLIWSSKCGLLEQEHGPSTKHRTFVSDTNISSSAPFKTTKCHASAQLVFVWSWQKIPTSLLETPSALWTHCCIPSRKFYHNLFQSLSFLSMPSLCICKPSGHFHSGSICLQNILIRVSSGQRVCIYPTSPSSRASYPSLFSSHTPASPPAPSYPPQVGLSCAWNP